MRLLQQLLVTIVLVGSSAGLLRAETMPTSNEPRLRGWYVGVSGISTWRDRYDVTGQPNPNFEAVESRGRGGSFIFGHRFGTRFLVGAHFSNGVHDVQNSTATISDIEALLTGTVLFREYETWQPFLRGGIGGSIQLLVEDNVDGEIFAYGTAAVAGGGLQIRLSSRFSIELDGTATFANFLETKDTTPGSSDPNATRQVRISQWGWRTGVGLALWF